MRTAPGRAACAPSPGPRFGRKALVLAVCALAACLCAGAAFATGEAGNGKFAVSDAAATAADQPAAADASSSETVLSFGDGVVTVAGDGVPEGTSLVVEDLAAADPAAIPELGGAAGPSGLEDALLVWDISLKDADGDEWQPYEEGSCVALTLDLAAAECGVEDGDVVTLTHVHEGVARDYDYVVVDGRITFWTDSFSIYAVASTTATSGTLVAADSTYGMAVGESQTFYWKPESADFPSIDGYRSARVNYCLWSVADGSNSVTYTVYDQGYVNGTSGAYSWKAPWVTIAAQNKGTVTVTMKANCTVECGDRWSTTTTTTITTTKTFTIEVSEQSGFHVEDKVAETGCLVPTWDSTAASADDGYTYTWTRSDGQAVRSEALRDDGAVNVSLDRGGVTNSRGPVAYTVTASKEGEELQTASFEVGYAQEVLNPSFETPDLSSIKGQSHDHLAVYNGYEGLYWRTTAPGINKDKEHLGSDVEIWATDNGENPDKLSKAADGKQFAELNAEAAGTLYQDVLTTSGAAFSWSFSHAARVNTSKNDVPDRQKMYVVVGASADAQAIVDNGKIKGLIDAAAESGGSIPVAKSDGSAVGLEFSYDANGDGTPGTYFIWQHTAETGAWAPLKGSCAIPEGQYLTRLFFVADPTQTGDGLTHGNFIDAVDAGEKMSYKVEYYPDGKLDSSKTESGTGAAYTAVGLENLPGYLGEGYVVTSVEVNGRGYPGDIANGLYVTDYGIVADQAENILVKVTLRKKAVIVTKVLDVEGWDGMTDEERSELVRDYTAEFGLYEEGSGDPTATAILVVAGVSSDGAVSVTGEFGKVEDGTYIVRETGCGEIYGYALSGTNYAGGDDVTGEGGVVVGEKVTVSDGSPVAAVTVTNSYAVADTSLTIEKKAAEGTTFADGETFVFTVTGDGLPEAGMQVVIGGADVKDGKGSVTINGLKVGSAYTVAEDGGWSWRYGTTTVKVGESGSEVSGASASVALDADASKNTVTFTNEKTDDDWLDFSGWCRNLFGGSGVYDGVGVGEVTGGAARPAAQAS